MQRLFMVGCLFIFALMIGCGDEATPVKGTASKDEVEHDLMTVEALFDAWVVAIKAGRLEIANKYFITTHIPATVAEIYPNPKAFVKRLNETMIKNIEKNGLVISFDGATRVKDESRAVVSMTLTFANKDCDSKKLTYVCEKVNGRWLFNPFLVASSFEEEE